MRPVKPTVCDDKKSQSTRSYKNSVCSDENCQETQNIHMQPVKPAKESNNMWSVNRSSKMKATLQSSSKQKNPVKQASMCSHKKCQDKKCVNMLPVKPEMDIQSKESQSSFKKKHAPLCSDKNCQSTRCYKKSEYSKCDKNCQSTHFMWPKKPISNMQSVTKSSSMELSKPARKQVIHKNCQSIKNYKKMYPVRPVCDDKNCQSANNMCSDKKQTKTVCNDKNCQFTHSVHMWTTMKTSDMWSVPKTACNQIRTQPEVTRNISSTSKHLYPFRNAI